MFTVEHFIWIGICVVFIVGLTLLARKLKFSLKTANYIITGICLASELCKVFTHMEAGVNGGMVIKATALPLHLCSMLLFLIFYITFAKEEKYKPALKSFVTVASLIGGTLAILMATSGTKFNEPYSYQCFVYHAGLMWYAIYLIMTKNVDMGIKSYFRNITIISSLMICMLWVNGALKIYDTNFFFLVKPPVEGLPLLNLNNGWYVYLLTIVMLGIIFISLVHLPFIIKELKNKKSQNLND
ncbi:MAG: YwaF family protein [Clostridia bacterium]|nr:YwaF family protein [Clostridia bacterium]